MKTLRGLITLVGLVSVVLSSSCGPGVISPPETQPVIISTAPTALSWQQDWENLIGSAQKEGKLVVATSAGPPVREAYNKAFGSKYGLTIEFLIAKPAEMVPKLQAERRAGIYVVDVILAGLGTVVPLLGPEGALEPLDKVLFLPEVLDAKNWWDGKLLWTDPNKYQLMYFATPRYPVSVNSNIVNVNEIRSYDDLLDRKWKGKISLLDPTMAGPGNEFFAFMADLKSLEYLRALAKQDIIITRDQRLQAEWLAREKYPIGIGTKPELMTELKDFGVSIATIKAAEGAYLTSSGGGVVLLNKAPDPNTAKLFINWLLSKEGQTVASRAYSLQSAREDVPTDHLDPDIVRQAGVKYRDTNSEAYQTKRAEHMQTAREVWQHLLK